MTKQDARTIIDRLDLNPDVEVTIKEKIDAEPEGGVGQNVQKEIQSLIQLRKILAETQRDLIEQAIKGVEATDKDVAEIAKKAEEELEQLEKQGKGELEELLGVNDEQSAAAPTNSTPPPFAPAN